MSNIFGLTFLTTWNKCTFIKALLMYWMCTS